MAVEIFTLPDATWTVPGVLAVTSLVLLGFVYIKSQKSGKNLPKGPPSLPILGSLPFLGKDILKDLDHMRETYGDIFMLCLQSPTVVLNGYTAIKEALVKQGDAFVGRPKDMVGIVEVTKGFGRSKFYIFLFVHLWFRVTNYILCNYEFH